jgi:pyruvate/2-oxoglutarate dehydrogenase complex dihydrolipoamide dehydrogenase (E3) component
VHEVDVAIIGAGPYGLSLAAQLKALRVEYRVFGTPMSFWRDCVPPDMELKSEGRACDLFDWHRQFTIEAYYREISRPFVGRVIVPAEIFLAYGLEFQKRFASDVDLRDVANVSRSGDRFVLRLQDGSVLGAGRVVVATGIRDYAYVPEVLRGLPREFVTHSAEYGPVDNLAGRKVLVIGGGASAIDLAWSLFQRDSDVTVACRRPEIRFHPEPPRRNWYSAIRSPDSPIGGGWKLFFYSHAPQAFRLLPAKTRREIVATTLGPFPGWFMTERVRGRVPIVGGLRVAQAEVIGGQVKLTMQEADNSTRSLTADHVVAATGYRVDVNKLPFLDNALKKRLRMFGQAPVVSRDFATSEPGLYFMGVASAPTFGPVMRFVAGAGFTARKLSRRLASARESSQGRSATSEIRFAE